MSAELQERARHLEARAAAIREELDDIYAELTDSEEDSFMFRLAARFQEERDTARRELAVVKAQLSTDETTWEARFRAVESRFHQMRRVIAAIVNDPLSPRDQVQSSLLLVHEKVRDFTP